jgi:transposase
VPAVIQVPVGTRIWLVAGLTDMRYGFQGLSAKVQTAIEENPLGGNVFIFRGRRGDLVKVLWATEDGLWLLARRLERGRFVWPQADGGKIHLTSAQLSMLLEGIDWRQPRRTAALSML